MTFNESDLIISTCYKNYSLPEDYYVSFDFYEMNTTTDSYVNTDDNVTGTLMVGGSQAMMFMNFSYYDDEVNGTEYMTLSLDIFNNGSLTTY